MFRQNTSIPRGIDTFIYLQCLTQENRRPVSARRVFRRARGGRPHYPRAVEGGPRRAGAREACAAQAYGGRRRQGRRLGAACQIVRVVLDTDVVVSAILFTKGHLTWLREGWCHGRLLPGV